MSETQPLYAPSRNPYVDRLKRAEVLANEETESWTGRWRERLNLSLDAELHAELGCNAGHVIRAWAAQAPEKGFIGIDWKYKQIFRGHDKGQKAALQNITFIRAKAQRLEYIFAPGELTSLSVFFPDPWPKKRHHKHRYLRRDWLSAMHPRIASNGWLHIKTDHRGYFDEIVHAVEDTPWRIQELNYDLHAGNPDAKSLVIPQVTLFERLFIAKGLPIHSIVLTRTQMI
jgi:tRNA (guanine-N7-)-methyltransferase